MELLASMIPLCSRCYVFDNSLDTGYRLILQIDNGSEITVHSEDPIPIWIERYVFEKLGIG
jgi:hypothetical protein